MASNFARLRAPAYSRSHPLGQVSSHVAHPVARISAAAILSAGLAVSLASPAEAAPPSAANGAPIIAVARSLTGIPYRRGGSTPAGFDCSGFTSYVYRQVGKGIPRSAEGQRAASHKVANPQPGDLIFFGVPAYHVGIFAGGGSLIDSPRSGKSTTQRAIWTYKNVSYGRF